MSLAQALIAIDRALPEGALTQELEARERVAADASEATPVIPEAVVWPRTTQEVAATLRACHAHSIPVTTRSGGTGRVGGAVPSEGAIVLSMEKMNRLVDIDPVNLRAHVEPGVVLGDLHAAVEAQSLFYGPDPNSLESCQLGGNLAANAGGPRAFKYGVTSQWVLGLEVVTADGTILQVGRPTAKGVTGYDLSSLIVGSEGTLAVICAANLRLVPKPEAVSTLMVFLEEQAAMQSAITTLLGRGLTPRCVEFLDQKALEIVAPTLGAAVPKGAASMLLVEIDGPADALEAQTELTGNVMLEVGALDVLMARDETQRGRLWAARRQMSHSMRARAAHKLAEDVVVPRTKISRLLSRCGELAETYAIEVPTYGHAGDGNLHVNFLWDDESQRPAVDQAIEALFVSVIREGGTLSGEHGIGTLKAPYLGLEQSDALIALQERIKSAFDPRGILNPGKIFVQGERRFHGSC